MKIWIKAVKKKSVDGITPIVQSMKGSFRMPDDFDYKNEMAQGLAEKYLK